MIHVSTQSSTIFGELCAKHLINVVYLCDPPFCELYKDPNAKNVAQTQVADNARQICLESTKNDNFQPLRQLLPLFFTENLFEKHTINESFFLKGWTLSIFKRTQ